MTRILCAPTNLHPDTAASIAAMSQPVELISIDPRDRYAYWRLIKERWTEMDDLLIIEQDMKFPPEYVTDILFCDKDWCVRGYMIGRGRNLGCLGFTKFSAHLMCTINPDILEQAMMHCDLCHGEYWHLDFHLTDTARVAGFWCHDHGDIEHLHEYDPMTPLMKVGTMTSSDMRNKLTQYMKDNGWSGPGVHQSHEHTPDCHCIWREAP